MEVGPACYRNYHRQRIGPYYEPIYAVIQSIMRKVLLHFLGWYIQTDRVTAWKNPILNFNNRTRLYRTRWWPKKTHPCETHNRDM